MNYRINYSIFEGMYFFKLIRPLNLVIVALTMYGLAWYFESVFGKSPQYGITSLPFSLLALSTIMIAAAGNIINDYFDIKADRINKPDRVIIGVHIKRRVAIVSHWGLNFFAFSIAVYLSWIMESFLYLFVHLMSINILWFYSMKAKRQFLTGNVLIAGLTATVPLLIGLYFYQVYGSRQNIVISHEFPFLGNLNELYTLYLTFGLAIFAFILNLAREIVKDIEDIEGDKKLRAKTLPIVLGQSKSKTIVILILSGTIIASSLLWPFSLEVDFINWIPLMIAAILIVVCFVLLPKAKERRELKRINSLIKLAMVFGTATPIYWNILMIYG